VIGGFIRYSDRQDSYEAVKEYMDALVRTYVGYHIYRPEYSRSSNHKTDSQKGINYSLQFYKKIKNLKIILNGNYGYTTNNIETGSTSKPTNVAYWQREGNNYSSDFIYDFGDGKSSVRIGYDYKKTDDWAKNPEYNTVVIENEEIKNRINFGLFMIPNMLMKFSINGNIENVNQNYKEHINMFEYTSDHINFGTDLYFQMQLTDVLSLDINGGYGKFKPHFTWEIDSFNEFNIGTGIERYFRFGFVKIEGNYTKYSPSDGEKNINEYQINLSLRK